MTLETPLKARLTDQYRSSGNMPEVSDTTTWQQVAVSPDAGFDPVLTLNWVVGAHRPGQWWDKCSLLSHSVYYWPLGSSHATLSKLQPSILKFRTGNNTIWPVAQKNSIATLRKNIARPLSTKHWEQRCIKYKLWREPYWVWKLEHPLTGITRGANQYFIILILKSDSGEEGCLTFSTKPVATNAKCSLITHYIDLQLLQQQLWGFNNTVQPTQLFTV